MTLLRRALRSAGAAVAILATASVAAFGFDRASGYATTSLNLRAGPGVDYPLVATIPDDARVDVYGCTNGYRWCDVGWRGNRGWAAGNYLQLDYQNSRRPVSNTAVLLGVPLLIFALDRYWDDNYEHRDFYASRHRYRGKGHDAYRDGRDGHGWDRTGHGRDRDGRDGHGRDHDGRDGDGGRGDDVTVRPQVPDTDRPAVQPAREPRGKSVQTRRDDTPRVQDRGGSDRGKSDRGGSDRGQGDTKRRGGDSGGAARCVPGGKGGDCSD